MAKAKCMYYIYIDRPNRVLDCCSASKKDYFTSTTPGKTTDGVRPYWPVFTADGKQFAWITNKSDRSRRSSNVLLRGALHFWKKGMASGKCCLKSYTYQMELWKPLYFLLGSEVYKKLELNGKFSFRFLQSDVQNHHWTNEFGVARTRITIHKRYTERNMYRRWALRRAYTMNTHAFLI